MAKITITRLPNATEEYSPNQFDQMVSYLILTAPPPQTHPTNYQQDLKEESQSEAFFLG